MTYKALSTWERFLRKQMFFILSALELCRKSILGAIKLSYLPEYEYISIYTVLWKKLGSALRQSLKANVDSLNATFWKKWCHNPTSYLSIPMTTDYMIAFVLQTLVNYSKTFINGITSMNRQGWWKMQLSWKEKIKINIIISGRLNNLRPKCFFHYVELSTILNGLYL